MESSSSPLRSVHTTVKAGFGEVWVKLRSELPGVEGEGVSEVSFMVGLKSYTGISSRAYFYNKVVVSPTRGNI